MKIILIILLFTSTHIYSDHITVVFSDGGPPFSYVDESENAVGVTPELVKYLLENIKPYNFTYIGYPWKRAQQLIESGESDIFATYPSDVRKNYAIFTENPIYYQEYGYLIFSKKNKNILKLKNAKNFNALKSFIFVSQSGIGWEEENIPKSINRVYGQTLEQLFHITFLRNGGDFFIMNLEQAVYYSKILGYIDDLDYIKVDFIPDSSIPIHIGISKKSDIDKKVIEEIDSIILNKKFSIKRDEIFNFYQGKLD